MLWTPNICRICAQISNICVPIFEKDSSSGIDTKIRRCLSSNISRDDLKPKQACEDCVAKLNDFCNFVALFHESNYRFESLLYPSENDLATSEYVDLDLSLTPKVSDLNINPYKEDMMPLENLDVRDFNEQNILNEIVKQTDVGIEMTSFTPNENNMLDEITSNNHNLEKISSYLHLDGMATNESFIKMPQEPNYDGIRGCGNFKKKNLISVQEICKEVERQQKIDVGDNCDKLKFCRNRRMKNTRICSRSTKSPENVEDEVLFNDILNEVHLDVQNFESHNDSEILKRNNHNLENSFAANFEPATSDDTTAKKKCKFNLLSVKTIRKANEKPLSPAAPKNKNDSAKRYECKECGKSFARRIYLNEHIKKHDKVRPYVCEICNKCFAIQRDLTFHKRIHTTLFSCTYCNKCFSSPSKLQRHVRTHTGERPFVCSFEDCARSFSDKRNLMGHQLTHTNIRRFTCGICKRSYKTNNQLKDHMRAHSEVPAFSCDVCNKSYRWKTNLVIHMKTHNGFHCSNCGKDCGKRSIFLKHRKECNGSIS